MATVKGYKIKRRDNGIFTDEEKLSIINYLMAEASTVSSLLPYQIIFTVIWELDSDKLKILTNNLLIEETTSIWDLCK